MITKLVASTTNAEVLGQRILGYVNCLRQDEVKPILAKHQLSEVQPLAWYPHQTILDVLNDIERQEYESLVDVGLRVIEQAVLPLRVHSIPAALASLGMFYQKHHRNVTEKGWYAEQLEPGHIQVYHDSPYPEDLAYGIVWGVVNRFRPVGAGYMVVPFEEGPFHVYDITWNVA